MTAGEGHTKGLSELLAKVQAASGPDRSLDLDLPRFLVPDVVVLLHDNGANVPHVYWKYTGSIDDALALVERVLPGWAAGFDAGVKTRLAFVDRHDHADRMFGAQFTAEAPTIPLAILAAILQALIEAQP